MSESGERNNPAPEPPTDPKLRRLNDAARNLAATRARLEAVRNLAWAITPVTIDPVTGVTVEAPRPDPLPPLPWHTS